MRMTTRFPKVSNRERQRLAQAALRKTVEMRILLLAVLAQKGGEVIVTEGTIHQVTGEMDFEVIVNPANEKERIVRIVK